MSSTTRISGKSQTEHTTRTNILNATTKLLGTNCLHSISIRDIARESKANSALISYHFGSKEKLYEAVIKQQFQAYNDLVVATFRSDGDIRANLKNACTAISEFHQQNPHWLVFYFRELTNPSGCYATIILPAIANASKKATEMVQAGIDQSIFKPDTNPRYVVQSFIGLVNYCFTDLPPEKRPEYFTFAGSG